MKRPLVRALSDTTSRAFGRNNFERSQRIANPNVLKNSAFELTSHRKHVLRAALTARANFNLRAKPAHLQLERVRQEDEGDYRCRVDFRHGRTVNTIISLRVVVPPEDISITTPQKPHTKLEGLIGPFNEGTELALVCLATGGKPRPQITWRRDFNVIDETYQHVDKDGKWV